MLLIATIALLHVILIVNLEILLMGTFDRSLMTNEFVEILVSVKKRLG